MGEAAAGQSRAQPRSGARQGGGGGAVDAWIDYIHRGRRGARLLDLHFGGKKRLTPLYFPSVSSSAQRSSVDTMIGFCVNRGAPQMLVSAYDMEGGKVPGAAGMLEEYAEKGVLLLDSGAFEAHYADKGWKFDKYAETVKATPCDIYASLDKMPRGRQADGYMLGATCCSTRRSELVRRNARCMAILHGATENQLAAVAEGVASLLTSSSRGSATKNQPAAVAEGVAGGAGGPRMYAVPEREMGDSVAEKIETAVRIRRALSGADPRNVLHVLGCGDPVLMTLLVYAGVDSFDSVDWSRWAINPVTFEWVCADRLEFMGCECAACAESGQDTLARMWGHNLLFYEGFTGRLRDAIYGDRDFDSLGAALGGGVAETARVALGEG